MANKKNLTYTVSAAAIALTLSGCGEITHSNGVLGQLADKLIMKTETPEADVYRATMVTAALMLLGEERVNNQGNLKQAIEQFSGIVDSLSAMYDTATTPCGYPVGSPAGLRAQSIYREKNPNCKMEDGSGRSKDVPAFASGFEMEMHRFNLQVYNLATVTLPEIELRDLITKTVSQDYFGALKETFIIVREVALAAGPLAATYRSGWHGRVAGFESRAGADKTPQQNFIEKGSYTEAAKIISGNATIMNGVDYPTKEAFFALFREMQQSCLNMKSRLPEKQVKGLTCPDKFLGSKLPLKGLYGADAGTKPAAG